MEPLSKKEIRTKVEESVSQALEKLEITNASKKTKKVVKATSRKLTGALKKELKKLYKKNKKAETIKDVKPKKAVKAKGAKKVAAETPEQSKIAS
ncbi:MAG: hypothetical protein RIA63_07690 [Cyclobacteriaceae bacterium]